MHGRGVIYNIPKIISAPPLVYGALAIKNCIPYHYWDCRWWAERGGEGKVSISLQYEKPVTHAPLTKRFQYRPLSCFTTEVVKRNDWCSGLRKRSPGSVVHQRPATVQWSLHMSSVRECSWYNKAKNVFRLRRLLTVCFECIIILFFLSNYVRHEGASIFLYMDN